MVSSGARPLHPRTPLLIGIVIGALLAPCCVALAQAEPLAVILTTPIGETEEEPVITARFSAPMVALGDGEETNGRPVLTFMPPIAGEQRWEGVDLVRFYPDEELPRATVYHVTIPAGIHDASGERILEEPVSWRFESPLPRVLVANNTKLDEGPAPDTEFSLLFNADVDPAEIAAHLILEVAEARFPRPFVTTGEETEGLEPVAYTAPLPVEFQVSRSDPIERQHRSVSRGVAVRPLEPFPLGAKVTLTLVKGFHSTEGPVAARESFEYEITVREPLRVVSVTCSHVPCRPESTLVVQLNNELATRYAHAASRVLLSPGEVSQDQYHGYSNKIRVDAVMLPDTEHTLTVLGGLRDRHWQPLAETAVTLAVGPHLPWLNLEQGFLVIDRRSPHALVGEQAHVRGFEVKMAAVSRQEVAGLVRWIEDLAGEPHEAVPAVVRRARPIIPEENTHPEAQLREFALPLADLVPEGESGALYFEVHGEELPVSRGLALFTGLGLTVRGDARKALILVTDLATAEPVPGARVAVKNEAGSEVWAGTTGAAGIVEAPGREALGLNNTADLWAVAATEDDWAALRLPRVVASPAPTLVGHLVADRGIYRPGDRVRFKGYARIDSMDGLEPATPRLPQLAVRLVDSHGDELAEQVNELGVRGNFHGDFEIPAEAGLGQFRLVAMPPSGGPPPGGDETAVWGRLSTRFRVAEYRVPEFEVVVTPARPEIVRGEEARFTVVATNLHGTPVRGAGELAFDSRRAYHRPPGFPGASFQPLERTDAPGLGHRRGSRGLDDSGTITHAIPTEAGDSSVPPTRLKLEAVVQAVTRQTVAASSSVLVHPGEFYLGVRFTDAEGGRRQAGGLLTVEVLAVHPDGSPLEDTARIRDLSVRLLGPIDVEEEDTPPPEILCEPAALATPPVVATCSVRASRAGVWTAKASAKDSMGNPLEAGATTYIYLRREDTEVPANTTAAEGEIPEWIGLRADRDLYIPGDQAQISLRAPSPLVSGILTTEAAGLRDWRPAPLAGTEFAGGPVAVPLGARDLPDIRVALTAPGVRETFDLVNGRDRGRPTTYEVRTRLDLDVESQRLAVDVMPARSAALPGEELVVRLRASDAAGRGLPAEVTLWAVDEGVLLLEPFEVPDLLGGLFPHHGRTATWQDNRSLMPTRFGFLDPDFLGGLGTRGRGRGASGYGSGGGYFGSKACGAIASPAPARSRFETVPYYNPGILTDDAGEASVTVSLPDNLSRFRFFAMASAGIRQFGSGESTVTVSLPVVLRPALPRFVHVGDRFHAGVIAENTTLKAHEVSVTVAAMGIGLEGEASQTRWLQPGQQEEVAFDLMALEVGEAVLEFRAADGALLDAVEARLPVKRRVITESTATYGVVEEFAEIPLAVPSDILPDHGGLEIGLASTALAGLSDAAEYLVQYPYGCVEQTSSRMVPRIALGEMGPELAGIRPDEVPVMIRAGIERLEGMSLGASGFAYWPGGRHNAHPYASLYATMVLLDAQRAGYPVDGEVLDNARIYLGGVALDGSGGGDRGSKISRAFALYLLSQAGPLPAGAVKPAQTLAEGWRDLPLFARFWLVTVLRGLPVDVATADFDPAAAADEIFQSAINLAHESPETVHFEEPQRGLGRWMHSSHRSDAIALDALLVSDPQHPYVDKLAAGLMQARRDGRWATTQENGWAVRGLARYLRTVEAEKPDFVARVSADDDLLLARAFEGRSGQRIAATVSFEQLAPSEHESRPLTVTKEGSGRLYYRLGLTYAPADQDLPPRDAGIGITRSYRSASCLHFEDADTVVLAAGEVVEVTLTIETPDRRYFVAIEDPLPAGLEAVDPQSATTARLREQPQLQAGFLRWDHREMRDDRVMYFADVLSPGTHTVTYLARATTPGTFRAGPTQAQEMYNPEVFGRTVAVEVEVVAP